MAPLALETSQPTRRGCQPRALISASFLCLAASLIATGCTTQGRLVSESTAFKQLWAQYNEMPNYRAMAVAGRLDSDRWVAGVAAGLPTTEAAEQRALIECRKKRRRARMASVCRFYAIGERRMRDADRSEDEAESGRR